MNTFEDLGKGRENLIAGEIGRAFFCNDVDIPKSHHFVSVQTKILSRQSFDSISLYRFSDFPAYCNSNSRTAPIGSATINDEVPILNFFSVLYQIDKLWTF
jgi:hypothetical protein